MRPALQKSGQVWVRTPGTSKRGIPREIAEIAKVMSGVLDSDSATAVCLDGVTYTDTIFHPPSSIFFTNTSPPAPQLTAC